MLVACLALALLQNFSYADEREPSCKPWVRESGLVRDVSEFGEITLNSEQQILIADIHFPQRSDQRGLDGKFLEKLRKLLSTRPISFAVLGKQDRFRRLPSYVWFEDEKGQKILLQERLVTHADAVVSPLPLEKIYRCGHRSVLRRLLAIHGNLEKDTLYKFDRLKRFLYGAKDGVLWQKEGEFAIVTGVVQTTHQSKNAVNLNFGDNWKDDFTARLSSRTRVIVEMEHGPLEEMVGRRLRVRGILDLYNGPMIAVEHPEQLEFLPR